MKTYQNALLMVLLLCGLVLIVGMTIVGAPGLELSGLFLNTTTLRPSSDTFVSSGRSGSSFEGDEVLWVGDSDFNNQRVQRSLLAFQPPSEITTTTTITSAILRLYMDGWPTSNDALMTVQAQRIRNDWPVTITWAMRDTLQIDNSIAPVEIDVPVSAGWYEWNVTDFLQSWVGDSQRSEQFGLLMRARTELSGIFRGFWSNDCTDDTCVKNGRQPQLIIDYATATPTNTPTWTPTYTPTPTPGIRSIILSNVPAGVLTSGEQVTYYINIENGPYPLSSVVVTNTVPDQLALITDSIQAPLDWGINVDPATNVISWALTTDLPVSATVQLAYSAERFTPTSTSTATLIPTEPPTSTDTPTVTKTPTSTLTATPTPTPTDSETPPTEDSSTTPTPTATATSATNPTTTPTAPSTATPTATPTLGQVGTQLAIAKDGTPSANSGALISYNLTITNLSTTTLTGLKIADYVPLGTTVIDYGGGAVTMPPSQIILWDVSLLAGQSTTARGFSVKPDPDMTQVVNDLYFVEAVVDGNVVQRAVGDKPVITIIVEPDSALAYRGTPLLLESSSDAIVNSGAWIVWSYNGTLGSLSSAAVTNPDRRVFLPVVLMDGKPCQGC